MTAWADHGQGGNGEPLAIVLRPGNAGSNTAADHIEATRLSLAQLPRRLRRRVLVRADSAGGTHEFLEWLTAPSRRLHSRNAQRVQAQGSPAARATLGPLEDWPEGKAGPGVIEGIAERAVLREQYVKGERERLLTKAFMIRVIVLMTLLPDAGVREAVAALAGDLTLVPWGGTAGHRAGRLLAGARGPGLAGGRRRQGAPAEGVVAGRDADPGAGHAGEPGRVRLRRHRRRLVPVPAPMGTPAVKRHGEFTR